MISRAQRYKIIYKIETLCVINISIHLIILTIISKIAPNITIFNRGITAKDFTKKIAITKGEIKSDKTSFDDIDDTDRNDGEGQT